MFIKLNFKKILFIHIPRTGGTSIEKNFSADLDPTETDYKQLLGWCDNKKIWMQHATHAQALNTLNLKATDLFSFAFVRNPWDRCVSDYIWFSKYERARGTLKDYILEQNDFTRFFKRNRNNYRADHMMPQHKFIIDEKGKSLVDFIGRFEKLQDDYNIICEKAGIMKRKLPHANQTQHKHYTEYYNEETKQMVAEKYAKDIEYFGYKFVL